MDITIQPGFLSGHITAIPSKSQAHRLMICAAFADAPTVLLCPETNRDIEATTDCLRAFGANIVRTKDGYTVIPVQAIPKSAVINCHESGSTLRFLLPLAGALGIDTVLHMEGRLSQRPLSPLWEEMERMGCRLSRPTQNTVRCTGRLQPGAYTIPGNISSQFITGLLMALALLPGNSQIHITESLESGPYIAMTQQAMALFGKDSSDCRIHGGTPYYSPGTLTVEGDWSNGAFFLAAEKLGNPVSVGNLDPTSAQGDRLVESLLAGWQENQIISAADIPDLIPILAVVAAVKGTTTFTHIQRLRLKESDRVSAITEMITVLGGKAEATEDTLTVWKTGLSGGIVDSKNDHRIAMSAAIAATVCDSPVTILGAGCTEKSYPSFWTEYHRLGGNYGQYIR